MAHTPYPRTDQRLALRQATSPCLSSARDSVRMLHATHLANAQTFAGSLQLGHALLRQIGDVGRLHKPRVEQAGFAVLKAPDIPSVLVETAFISNPEEEEKLRSERYQDQLVEALMRGIVQYFSRNPPLARNRVPL